MNKYCPNCDRLLKIVSTQTNAKLECLSCSIVQEIEGTDSILYQEDKDTVPLEVKIKISNMDLISHNPVDYQHTCPDCKVKNTVKYIVDASDHKYYYKCLKCKKTIN